MDLRENIYYTTDNIQKKYNEFNKFTTNEQVIVVAIGVLIGLATKEVITNIMTEIVLPMFIQFGSYNLYNLILSKIKNKSANIVVQKLGLLIWYLLTWIIVLFIAYLFLTVVININPLGTDLKIINTAANYLLPRS
jgi:large-conductance mechanosensitive channel